MRINKFVALASNLSRRQADEAVAMGRVKLNGQIISQGTDVNETDVVTLDGHKLTPAAETTVMFNKPVGYVVSRDGQGSRTIYDLLPHEYQQLQPVGRLDKDSSGLLLLTNNGALAQELTHPSHQKIKVYHVSLDKPLQPLHHQMICDHGIQLADGLSKLQLDRRTKDDDTKCIIRMHEGRNRQIRRTFAALGYTVQTLHRTEFGSYHLENLEFGAFRIQQT